MTGFGKGSIIRYSRILRRRNPGAVSPGDFVCAVDDRGESSVHMPREQVFYLGVLGVQLVFFVLFLRLFVWKRYSEQTHWLKRPPVSMEIVTGLAQKKGEELPFLSLFVPARNEADVIHRTVEHLARLDYPSDRYEIIVATDQKEEMDSEKQRILAISEANQVLKESLSGHGVGDSARMILLEVCCRSALEEARHAQRRLGSAWPPDELLDVPKPLQIRLVRETAELILRRRGRFESERLFTLINRALPKLDPVEVHKVKPVFLSLALPALLTHSRICRYEDERMIKRLLQETARASQIVTQEIIQNMAETIAGRIIARVNRLQGKTLDEALAAAFRAVYPTTQDCVEAKKAELEANPDFPKLKHIIVPFDFDGVLGGRCIGAEVPSTKGRALNYALGFIDPRSSMAGFYDAESRPDHRVLLHVAFRRLTEGEKVGILQGPVFQVRNFYQMGPLCKIVSLYQSISHDWYLPFLFRTLPFVGGTNLFIATGLLRRIGGYDQGCLTEDIELGARAYLQENVWPEYLPYPSSEQTPTTFKAFFRQRLRWGSGYLQVFEKIRDDERYPSKKKAPLLRTLFIKGHLEWSVYQFACFVPAFVFLLWYLGLLDPDVVPMPFRFLVYSLSLVYIGFTYYAYFRYSGYLDAIYHPNPGVVRAGAFSHLLLVPFSAFLLPTPYSWALILKLVGRDPKSWVKTPRTRE